MTSMNLHSLLNYFRGTAKVVDDQWQKVAHTVGLTQAEQHTLSILYFEDRASITTIANHGLWDRSTVMQVVKRLKEKDLVTVEKDDQDLRVSYVLLTEEGRKRLCDTVNVDNVFFNYVNEWRTKDREGFQQFICFLMRFNEEFHGEEYVKWVETTSEIYEQDFLSVRK